LKKGTGLKGPALIFTSTCKVNGAGNVAAFFIYIGKMCIFAEK
jgi:hypothetical protein